MSRNEGGATLSRGTYRLKGLDDLAAIYPQFDCDRFSARDNCIASVRVDGRCGISGIGATVVRSPELHRPGNQPTQTL
jgi:hypothetical protein